MPVVSSARRAAIGENGPFRDAIKAAAGPGAHVPRSEPVEKQRPFARKTSQNSQKPTTETRLGEGATSVDHHQKQAKKLTLKRGRSRSGNAVRAWKEKIKDRIEKRAKLVRNPSQPEQQQKQVRAAVHLRTTVGMEGWERQRATTWKSGCLAPGSMWCCLGVETELLGSLHRGLQGWYGQARAGLSSSLSRPLVALENTEGRRGLIGFWDRRFVRVSGNRAACRGHGTR